MSELCQHEWSEWKMFISWHDDFHGWKRKCAKCGEVEIDEGEQ